MVAECESHYRKHVRYTIYINIVVSGGFHSKLHLRTYLWEQLARKVRCPAFLVWQNVDMFERRLRERDSLLRPGSKECEGVEFLIVYRKRKEIINMCLKWVSYIGRLDDKSFMLLFSWLEIRQVDIYTFLSIDFEVMKLTLKLETLNPVTVGWWVVRKPLRARWRYKKLACCIVTSCNNLLEIFPVTKDKIKLNLCF